MENWLSLHEYSNKHQVSVSTLRRRIKSQKIEYKLDEGKYYLLEMAASSMAKQTPQVDTSVPSQERVYSSPVAGENISTTRLLLDELKRAYLDSLQSKEDQILYLKQQVSDLQTLVMFLEKENERIKYRGR